MAARKCRIAHPRPGGIGFCQDTVANEGKEQRCCRKLSVELTWNLRILYALYQIISNFSVRVIEI